jgi:SAM-dependent methyltransferase
MSGGGWLGRECSPAFDLFQGYAVSSVLAGLEMSGDLSRLAAEGIDIASVKDRDLAATDLLISSLRYLVHRGVARVAAGTFTLTSYGETVYRDRGFLLWLASGYGEPLRQLGTMVTGEKRYGDDVTRDGRWVADGTALMAKRYIIPEAMALLSRLSFGNVLDLGCGNARFLIAVCRASGARGIGVDVSRAAYMEAEKAVTEAGLRDRIQLALGDVRALDEIPGIADVDLVVAFFLLHEFLTVGRESLTAYLSSLSRRLPPGGGMVIGEVEPPTEGTEEQVFTPEFSYVHAVMRQRLLSADDWSQVLDEGGFEVTEVVRPGLPGAILLHCAKRL